MLFIQVECHPYYQQHGLKGRVAAYGTVYCDSRSACYHTGHAFEGVAVKANAPELLDSILARKRRKIMVGTGSMSDPYQPCERGPRLTSRCSRPEGEMPHGMRRVPARVSALE